MLDFEVFIQGLYLIRTTAGCDLKENYLDAVYGIIKDDFTDNEFQCAVRDILRQEELYGKMPTPKQFLKYAPNRITEPELENYNKVNFLNKVSAYLNRDYIPTHEKEEFINNLTDLERLTLQASGGISELWQRVHDEYFQTNTAKIMKELGKFWDDNLSADKVRKNLEVKKIGEQQAFSDVANTLLESFKK